MSLPPAPHQDLSDNQLSVLSRLGGLNHNLLAFDMGVWGPYGTRRERHFVMTAYHQNANGEWVAREMPGAQTLDEWIEGWEFASVGFVMAHGVEKGVADAYRDHFKHLAVQYPRAWWISCMAEWELRHEWSLQELRRQRAFHAEYPQLSKYNPDKPWNSVLLAAVQGVEAMQYWKRALEDKARRWMDSDKSQESPSWVTRQEEYYHPALGTGSGQKGASAFPQNTQNPPGSGKRAEKRKASEMARQTKEAGRQQSATAPSGSVSRPAFREESALSWVDRRRSDGRWMYAKNEQELCYKHNREDDGCGKECSCKP